MRTLLRSIVLATLIAAIFSLAGCDRMKPGKKTQLADTTRIIHAFDQVEQWLDSGMITQTTPYLDSIFAVGGTVPDALLLRKYKFLANLNFQQMSDLAATDYYLDSVEHIVNRNPSMVDERLFVLFRRGDLALLRQHYEEAFNMYYQGKLITDSLGDRCKSMSYQNALANLYFKQERYKESLAFMMANYESGHSCNEGNPFGQFANAQGAFNNFGICYENLKMYDSSLYWYNKGLDLIERCIGLYPDKLNHTMRNKGMLLGNKGGVLLKMKRYEEAEKCLHESIKINFSPERVLGDAILTKIKLADLYLQTGRIRECGKLIAEITRNVADNPYVISESRLANLSYRYYLHIRQFDKALENLQKGYALKDSIQAKGYTINMQHDHNREFKTLEKQIELIQLQKKNESKNWYLLFAICGLITGIILLLIFSRTRKQQKKYIGELITLNEDIRKSNEQLKQSLISLEKSQEENTRIMKIVAHDLRSPIAGIMSLMSLLKGDELSKEETNEYLELVEQSGTHALSFINDLLHVNESGSNMQFERANLATLVDSCLQLLKGQAAKKGQEIHSSILPVVVMINQEKIWRVINNLVSNAIKFSQTGKNIYIDMSATENAVIISIRDEGIGIPESMREKMFDMFSGAGRTGTSGEKSFGLGLAISKQIIEAHKGKIWFESAENEGTTFYVKLPREV